MVWPEDKSPGSAVASGSGAATSAVLLNSTQSSLPNLSYESQALSSGSDSSGSSLQQESPAGSPVSKETVGVWV